MKLFLDEGILHAKIFLCTFSNCNFLRLQVSLHFHTLRQDEYDGTGIIYTAMPYLS